MKQVVVLLVLPSLILLLCSCRDNDSNKIITFKQRLSKIDALVARHKLRRQRLVKRPGSNQLTIYHPRKDDQHIATTYVLCRNKHNQLRLAGTYPNNQSHDWVISLPALF